MQYVLKRSKRKTLAIHITHEAQLIVRAPMTISIEKIEQLLHEKEIWIQEKLSIVEKAKQEKKTYSLCEGELMPFFGKDYPVKASKKLFFDGYYFHIPQVNAQTLKQGLISLYKSLIYDIIIKKVAYYSEIMQVKPSAVKINGAIKRWGSCSRTNSLNFSFLLAMVSETELNYVVVHELTHIKHHNHSDLFWKEVSRVIPDYKQRKQKLTELYNKVNHLFYD